MFDGALSIIINQNIIFNVCVIGYNGKDTCTVEVIYKLYKCNNE